MRKAPLLPSSPAPFRFAPPALTPANDNEPPEPPPAASLRILRLPRLMAAIADFAGRQALAAQAA